jgi:hypothetical protein
MLEIERGSTRSQFVERWIWKRLLTCPEAAYGMNVTTFSVVLFPVMTSVRVPRIADPWPRMVMLLRLFFTAICLDFDFIYLFFH